MLSWWCSGAVGVRWPIVKLWRSTRSSWLAYGVRTWPGVERLPGWQALFCGCSGGALVLFWWCSRAALVLFWCCSGTVLMLFWGCSVAVWGCSEPSPRAVPEQRPNSTRTAPEAGASYRHSFAQPTEIESLRAKPLALSTKPRDLCAEAC